MKYRINGIESITVIDLDIKKDDTFNHELFRELKDDIIYPAINAILNRLAEKIYWAYANGEIEGMHRFKFTVHTELEKHEGRITEAFTNPNSTLL